MSLVHDAPVDATTLKAQALSLMITVFVTLVATFLGYLWWWKRSISTRKSSRGAAIGNVLPSPVPALPLWMGALGGHTLLIRPEKFQAQLEGWGAEFGEDYEVTIFGKRVVVLTGLSDIRRVLTLRPSKFKRGLTRAKASWSATELEFIPSMFFDEGKDWGRSRRLISPNLSGHNVRAMLPIISKIGERLCARLGALADAGEIVDGKEIFERFTHDVIALTAFGIDVDSIGAAAKGEASPSYDAMESATTTLMALNLSPMKILGWRTLSTALPWVRRAMEHSHRLRDVVQSAIEAVRCESNKTDPVSGSVNQSHSGASSPQEAGGARASDNLAGGMLLRNIVKKSDGDGASERMMFSDVEVQRQAKSLFIAGTETTAFSLAWSIYYLAKNPGRFKRCREEALRVAPLSDGMVSTAEKLSELVFCAAVFKEALRLRTAAPYMFFHTKADHTLDTGMKLEKDRSVCVLARAASVSDEAFTKGKEFIPERWIEAEREEAIRGKMEGGGSIRHMEEALLSFGGGPRVCPGQDLARAESTIILAAICARFDVSLAPCQSDPPDEVMRFTSGPRAVMLRCTRKEK